MGGTYLTQLRNPRWLKYPVRTAGSNRLWQVQLPIDALPDGTEVDANGNLMCVSSRDRPPLYQVTAAPRPRAPNGVAWLGFAGVASPG